MVIRFVLAMGLGVVLLRPVSADEPVNRTIQSLYYQCKSDKVVELSFCSSYLLGIADSMAQNGNLFQIRQMKAPQTVTGSVSDSLTAPYLNNSICDARYSGASLRQIFIKWADKHPMDWQIDTIFGAAVAIQEAWPCK